MTKILMPAERVRLVIRLLDNGPMNRLVFFGQDPSYDAYLFVGMSNDRVVDLRLTGQILFGDEKELENHLAEWYANTINPQ